MKTPLLDLDLDELELPKIQIARHVREIIAAGKIAPRTRMPSTRELARAWEVPVSTVHLALVSLVKDGWLVRHHGSGTYIRQRAEKLTCVGIYYPEDTFGRSLFLQSLHAALKAELNAQDIETDVWLDPRPFARRDTPWAPFARAAEHREFQVSIIPVTDFQHVVWQTKLPVPTAFFTSRDLPHTVYPDMRQFAELSLQALARQGCRSVGGILPWTTKPAPDAGEDLSRGFFEHFGRVAQELGLTIKSQWMRGPAHEHEMRGRPLEVFGYEKFRELWGEPEKPEGLVVYPDTDARGAITAILEQRVRVPEELKLVFHQNEGVQLLCPLSATLVVSSERAIARALLGQVEKQFRGEPCEPIKLGFTLQPAIAVNQ